MKYTVNYTIMSDVEIEADSEAHAKAICEDMMPEMLLANTRQQHGDRVGIEVYADEYRIEPVE